MFLEKEKLGFWREKNLVATEMTTSTSLPTTPGGKIPPPSRKHFGYKKENNNKKKTSVRVGLVRFYVITGYHGSTPWCF